MKYSIYIFTIAILICASCTEDDNLDETIYIPDKIHSDLPAYTEWGYNTFGVYFDREVFVSNDEKVPLKVINHNDTTTFLFKGQKGEYNTSSYYSSSTDIPMEMKLRFTDFHPEKYSDLLVLNDSIFNFNDSVFLIELEIDGEDQNLSLFNGQFQFVKAQQLFIDEEQTQIILSGKFSFQIILDDEPITFSNGRFDFGVNENNFFYYK